MQFPLWAARDRVIATHPPGIALLDFRRLLKLQGRAAWRAPMVLTLIPRSRCFLTFLSQLWVCIAARLRDTHRARVMSWFNVFVRLYLGLTGLDFHRMKLGAESHHSGLGVIQRSDSWCRHVYFEVGS